MGKGIIIVITYITLLIIIVLNGCKKSDSQSTTQSQILTGQVTDTIALNNVQQTIDGFGESTAWSGALSTAQANVIFGNSSNTQMGLSLCRLRIDPGGSINWAQELLTHKMHLHSGQMSLLHHGLLPIL